MLKDTALGMNQYNFSYVVQRGQRASSNEHMVPIRQQAYS